MKGEKKGVFESFFNDSCARARTGHVELFFAFIIIILFVVMVYAAGNPDISFASPTLPNNTAVLGGNAAGINVSINISTTSADNHYAFVDFDKSLRVWIRMDDRNSDGQPINLANGTTNGTLQGGATINSTFGRFGNVSHFNGSQYITFNESIVSNGIYTGGLTVSAWFRANNTNGTILSKAKSSNIGTDSMELFIAAGKVIFRSDSVEFIALYTVTQNGTSPTDGTWVHAAVVTNRSPYNNGGVTTTLYINGVQNNISNQAGEFVNANRNLWGIGATAAGASGLIGSVDEILIFNRSLDSNEIASLYNATQFKYAGRNIGGISSGIHRFKGYAVNESGGKNETEERILNITSQPIGVLTAPSNSTLTNNATISFSANFTDDFQLRNTTLYIWNSTSLVNTTTRSINGTTNSTNISVTLPRDGVYFWNYLTYDNSSNGVFNATNFTLTYDGISPIVNITVPANITYTTSSFVFNVSLNENGTVLFSLNGGVTNYSMTTPDNRNFNYTNSSIRDGT
ncbi:LamG domain-containing protein, partial [Candidatus Pacearchaeota archaeon]|nr:LamG domain-containing protein [Candidatus Pacearchaeota archaeon]